MAGFGFDITEASKGAEAMTDIAAQPAELEKRKAAASSAVSQASLDALKLPMEKAKAEYEIKKYKSLSDYMNAPAPSEIGREQYEMMTDAQKIKAEEGALQQEEQRIRQSRMDPKDMKDALTPLESRRNKIDTLKIKVQQQTAKHLDADVAAVSGINDDASLAGYRGWKQQQAEGAADAAIKDHVKDPKTGIPYTSRQAFINDQLKGIPASWDKTAERWKDAHMAEGSSSKEFFSLQAEQQKTKQIELSTKKEIILAHAETRKTEAFLRTAEMRDAKEVRQDNEEARKNLAEHRKELESSTARRESLIDDYLQEINQINKELGTTPPTKTTGGFLGMGTSKIPDPVYTALQTRRDTLKTARDELVDVQKTQTTLLGTLSGGKPSAGIKPPPPAGKAEPASKDIETSAKAAWGTYEPTKYEYRVSPEGKIQRKAK